MDEWICLQYEAVPQVVIRICNAERESTLEVCKLVY